MKRVLVTGATGFIGSNLVRRLLHDGSEVHVLIRNDHITWRLRDIESDLRVHLGDVEDEDAVGEALSVAHPDWIFHLAAHGAYSSQTDQKRMVLTNVVGTVTLLESCLRAGFEAFVSAGSSSEYGFKDHAPTEDEALEPNSHYAVTKASASLYCAYTGRSRDVHVTTLRLYSAYGPYEDPNRLIPALAMAGLEHRLPPLVDPDVARDFVYIDDVVEAFVLAAARCRTPGAIYNVGTGRQMRLRDVVDVVRRLTATEEVPKWGSMSNRTWDTSVWVANPARIRRELGWSPKYTFEKGFSAFVSWLKRNPTDRETYINPGTR